MSVDQELKRQPRPSGPKTRSKSGIIRVGTASWSDPGFVEDWYPPELPASKRLAWYAEHFKLVEVNSTFYSVPAAPVVKRWSEQTPDDFVFDIKLHKLLSRHSTPAKFLPANLRSKARVHGDKVELTPQLESALTELFLEGIEPLYDSGKMGALLLQLTPSFRPRENTLSELDHLLGLLAGHTVAVELRHREWLVGQQQEKTRAYFKKRRVALVSVDGPQSEHFMVMPAVDAVTDPELAYLRAHGRNARGYISGRTVAERFDYQYSTKELEEIAERAEALSELASETHVIFNNNKSNYAPKAAARFERLAAKRSG